MVAHMRDTPALVAAFEDEGTSVPAKDKFWPVPVRTGVDLPWAVYEDVAGNTTYTTGPDSIEEGAIRFVVVADGKDAALALARLLASTLTDPPLEFDNGLLMYLRPGSLSVVPIGALAPGSPNAYAYGVTFTTMAQMTI